MLVNGMQITCICDIMLIYGLYPYSVILISYICYLHPIYQERGVSSSGIGLPSTTWAISSSGASNPGPKESFSGERELISYKLQIPDSEAQGLVCFIYN